MKLRFSLAFLVALMVTFSLMTSCSSDDTPDPTPDPDPMPTDTMTVEDDNLEVAPDFSLQLAGGGTAALDDYKDKVLVVFFFGNGCPPCKSVAPAIESELKQRFKTNDAFAIIGIDLWDGNEASVDGFRSQTGVTFPLALKGSSVGNSYGMTYDRLIIVNKKGKIAFKDNARRAANTLDEVMAKVNQLLK